MEGQWDAAVSSIQDILNANEALSLDSIYAETPISSLSDTELKELKSKITAHMENVEKSSRLVDTLLENTNALFRRQSQSSKGPAASKNSNNDGKAIPTTTTTTATKQKRGKRYVLIQYHIRHKKYTNFRSVL